MKATRTAEPWLLVTGDVGRAGAMDRANMAVTEVLARRGHPVHLVAHSVSDEVRSWPEVHVHLAPKPLGSTTLGSPVLDRLGRFWARVIARRGGRVVVNGGNCLYGDVNWVHYLHARYDPFVGAASPSIRSRMARRGFLTAERKALARARVLIANSKRTALDLEGMGVDPQCIRIVYCGIDSERFRCASQSERLEARERLGFGEQPLVAFVGALGDRRKGLDTTLAAWRLLEPAVRGASQLLVFGTGAELPRWRELVRTWGLNSVHFMGFRKDLFEVLRACDALVAPTRYEPYGLGVKEALCCELPAFVTRSAGVAEHYPANLDRFLLDSPDDSNELASRLSRWLSQPLESKVEVAMLAAELRSHDWRRMAEQLIERV